MYFSTSIGAIDDAIKILYSRKFQASLSEVCNPYGNGGASEKIVNALKITDIQGIVKKSFYDLPKFIFEA